MLNYAGILTVTLQASPSLKASRRAQHVHFYN